MKITLDLGDGYEALDCPHQFVGRCQDCQSTGDMEADMA
ncbi:hypothetical protein JOE31_001360 [Arthrobacter sp. PvP023]|nr:hypothetical protein [Arthrobacter sp. PvP023]